AFRFHVCAHFFFFSSRRRHTRSKRDWSSDVCSSDLLLTNGRLSPVVYLSMQRMLTKRIKEPSIMEPKALWNHLIRNMGALVASKIHVATHGGLHPHRPDILMP